MRLFSSIRRSFSIAVLMFFLLACAGTASAEKTKGIPVNPPKKKLKGLPTIAVIANDRNDELTDEEKILVQNIAQKEEASPSAPRQRVPLPPEVLAARPPVLPRTRAPQPPALPPGDPNTMLRNIPRPPARITQPAPPKAPPTTSIKELPATKKR